MILDVVDEDDVHPLTPWAMLWFPVQQWLVYGCVVVG